MFQRSLCFLCLFPTSPSASLPAACPLFLHRCAAGDADAGGEEDLSLPADGGHTAGHLVLPDTTVQTPLRTHQERQVSRPQSLKCELTHGGKEENLSQWSVGLCGVAKFVSQ